MAWDDCFTTRDYDRYMGYSDEALWEAYEDDDYDPDEDGDQPEDEQPAEIGEPGRNWRAHLNDESCPF